MSARRDGREGGKLDVAATFVRYHSEARLRSRRHDPIRATRSRSEQIPMNRRLQTESRRPVAELGAGLACLDTPITANNPATTRLPVPWRFRGRYRRLGARPILTILVILSGVAGVVMPAIAAEPAQTDPSDVDERAPSRKSPAARLPTAPGLSARKFARGLDDEFRARDPAEDGCSPAASAESPISRAKQIFWPKSSTGTSRGYRYR